MDWQPERADSVVMLAPVDHWSAGHSQSIAKGTTSFGQVALVRTTLDHRHALRPRSRLRRLHDEPRARCRVGVHVIRWDGWAERREALEAYPHCSVITNLQVHPPQRGRGVGRALIESAEKGVITRGLHRIGVGVADNNPRAAKLDARLGYADTGLRTNSRYMYPDDAGVPREILEHDILLMKDLEVVSSAEGTSALDWRS